MNGNDGIEDIWGDGRETNSTPIPDEWQDIHHRDAEDTEKGTADERG